MIAQDDPRHRQQRMLVQTEAHRAVGHVRVRTEIDALVTELLDAALAAGDEMEVVDALAGQLPARLTAGCSATPRSCGATSRSGANG